LKRTEGFFILCSENLSIFDCKTSTFLYYIPNLKLQGIEKPFGFSLKRNRADRLEEWVVKVPDYTNKMEHCELLEKW
jgi:hypothetical protein